MITNLTVSPFWEILSSSQYSKFKNFQFNILLFSLEYFDLKPTEALILNSIGIVTSGTQSPMLKEGIGLAYVHTDFAKVGTTIRIQIRDKNVLAEVVKTPFV